ncbi:chemotaxis response regulator protein-glutamate methylesterase [Proteinivorax hydrogeniformans]|uniref:Protein-glutamate methylesterase/protein-glutamine glutaminase n=1 Tax=Proteinivorax hydrogeniformans TaxID=1826727 RepID=A0AAU8HWE9_9FIRM
MIKAIIIDDSNFMRKVLKDILKDSNIQVVSEAENGFIGLGEIQKHNPDVVLLDVEMPILSGLDTLELIMKKCPTPVIMFSSLTKQGADTTIEALKLGAVDFLQKPKSSFEVFKLKDQILQKIKTANQAKLKDNKKEEQKIKTKQDSNKQKTSIKNLTEANKAIVVGCSTGGPKALTQLLTDLRNLKGAMLIVQHMPAFFTKTLARRLNDLAHYPVKEAEDGEIVKDKMIYLAPGDYHLTVVKNGSNNVVLKLDQKPAIHGCRPAVDYLFQSAAKIYKKNLVAAVLTGMGKDGLEGSKTVKKNGGKIIAESEETCTIYGMPKQVVEHNLQTEIAPINKIASELEKLQ